MLVCSIIRRATWWANDRQFRIDSDRLDAVDSDWFQSLRPLKVRRPAPRRSECIVRWRSWLVMFTFNYGAYLFIQSSDSWARCDSSLLWSPPTRGLAKTPIRQASNWQNPRTGRVYKISCSRRTEPSTLCRTDMAQQRVLQPVLLRQPQEVSQGCPLVLHGGYTAWIGQVWTEWEADIARGCR